MSRRFSAGGKVRTLDGGLKTRSRRKEVDSSARADYGKLRPHRGNASAKESDKAMHGPVNLDDGDRADGEDAKRSGKVDAGSKAPAPASQEHVARPAVAEEADAGAPRKRENVARRGLRLLIKAVVPVVVLFGAMSVYSYFVATKPVVKKRPKVERSYTVETVEAQPGSYTPKIRLFGTTTTGRQVDIRALVAGQVMRTGKGLREGGEIKKGDLLLEIDPFNFATNAKEAAAQLKEMQAKLNEQKASRQSDVTSLKFARQQLRLAKTDLQRAVPLARRGTVAKRTVDDRRNLVIQREQAVEQLQNSVRVWDARIAAQQAAINRMSAGLERAKRRLAETKLVAPFDAYVSEVGAQVGRIVSANDKVAMLIDRNWIEARFTLSDAQYGRIIAAEKTLKGRPVKVLWRVGRDPIAYDAVIERIGAQISADSGGVEVFARIAQPTDKAALRPGAFVEIEVPDKTYKQVFKLPETALFNGDTVYAVVEGRLDPRKVTQVGIAEQDLLVTGELFPGDRIITTRLSTPGKGVKVRDISQEQGSGRSGSGSAGAESRRSGRAGEGAMRKRAKSNDPGGKATGGKANGAKNARARNEARTK